jgi:hypothetical protein
LLENASAETNRKSRVANIALECERPKRNLRLHILLL